MTTIKIYNNRKNSLPRLSNNFPQEMTIDGIKYRSVTNYIYSNMLRTAMPRSLMSNAKTHGKCVGSANCRSIIGSQGKCSKTPRESLKTMCENAGCTFANLSLPDQYEEFREKENMDFINTHLDIALESKISNSDELTKILLSTGNRPVRYISDNNILGIGLDGNGKNVFGKVLQEMRVRFSGAKSQQIRNENMEKMNTKKYNTYVAYTNLTKLLMTGNDLNDYEGMTSTEVLEKMKNDNVAIGNTFYKDLIITGINKIIKNLQTAKVNQDDDVGGECLEEIRAENYSFEKLRGEKSWIDINVIISIFKPNSLSVLVRGDNLGKLAEQLVRNEKKLVLGMYMDYLLRKQFPNIKPERYEEARNQQLVTLDQNDLTKLQKRVWDMYNKGMLSASLSDLIDDAKKKVPAPKDIETAGLLSDAIKKSFDANKKPILQNVIKNVNGETVDIYVNTGNNMYDVFSPLHKEDIDIANHKYPSITHYLFTMNLSVLYDVTDKSKKLKRIGVDKAYDMLTTGNNEFKTIKEIEEVVDRLKDHSYNEEIKIYTKTALYFKFNKSRESQNELISTENKRILWEDRRDDVLGSGADGRGFNFVGKVLEKIREIWKEARKGEKIDQLSTDDITKVFDNKFLRGWFRMKTHDMCNIIVTMKDYMYIKHAILIDDVKTQDDTNKHIFSHYTRKGKTNPTSEENLLLGAFGDDSSSDDEENDNEKHLYSKDEEIDEKEIDFVTTVLDKIYLPCSHIFAATDKIKVEAPEIFKNMVTDYHGCKNMSNKVIDILWKRIAVIIYYLIELLVSPTSINIVTTLGQIEGLVSKRRKCKEIIQDPEDNCILGAILNILKGVIILDKKYGKNKGVQVVDFDAATTILLNINSLNEQRALRLKKSGIVTHKPEVDINYIEKVKEDLKAFGYSKTIIKSVIDDIKLVNKQIDYETLAMSKKAEGNDTDIFKRKGKKKKIYRKKSEINEMMPGMNDGEIGEYESSEDESEDESEAGGKDNKTLPSIPLAVVEELKLIGVDAIDIVPGLIVTMDKSIRFVKDYKLLPSRIKTNRINFFSTER